jgi:small-conductance mechanosensitive channel
MQRLQKELMMNSVEDYGIAIGIVVVGTVFLRIARALVTRRLKRGSAATMEYFLQLENYIFPVFYLAVVYAAISYLTFSTDVELFIYRTATVGFVFLLIRVITSIFRIAIYSYVRKQDVSTVDLKLRQINGIVLVINGIFWLVGIIFIFDNLGFNVTAVLTGLGVGGIAIALAAQTILGDIFNYFVIFFDRPFELGDFIIVDDKMGTVEFIGLKTTRIRSLQGEQIVFSNSNLTNSRINNYKRMKERRVVFTLRIVYKTTHDVLQQIPELLKNIIESRPMTRFDRAHFWKFETYSLDFEVVYYVLTADYNQFMDIQQQINLDIYREFEERNIRLALPTYDLKFSPVQLKDNHHDNHELVGKQN